MRTTVTLDDKLVAASREYVGEIETSKLLNEALTALIQREAAQRLAAIGGSDPNFNAAPRRRAAG